MKLYNNEITRRIIESSCIRPFVNNSGVLCRCGSCYACKQKSHLDWSFRLECENNSSYVACKLGCTLTYDNLHLPLLNLNDNKVYSLNEVDGYDLEKLPSYLVPVLYIEHYQKFVNALRERIKYRFDNLFLRYFVSCEYGGANYRPHYHFGLWVCIIDEDKPVRLVLSRDREKNITCSTVIDPVDYESIIQKGYIENWILGSDTFLSPDPDETDNHPLTPSRCLHRVPDLWPYAESRLKYDEKTQSLKWKCVSIETLGSNWGGYLGGYLSKEDLKVLAPGSAFVPEQRHMSQSTKFFSDGKRIDFGCLGFEWCERNKDYYLNSLRQSQLEGSYCFLSRFYQDKKGKQHIVSIPRAYKRYYYKLYSGITDTDWSRLTKIVKSFQNGFVDKYVVEKKINYANRDKCFVPLKGAFMVDNDVTLPHFFHDEVKYNYKKVFAFFPYAPDYLKRLYTYAVYLYKHSVRYLQPLAYSKESLPLFEPLGDKLEQVAEYYPYSGQMCFTGSEYSPSLSELYSIKVEKYRSLVSRTIKKSTLKVTKNLQKVRHRVNSDILGLQKFVRAECDLSLSLLDDRFNPVGCALNKLIRNTNEKKKYLFGLSQDFERAFNCPCVCLSDDGNAPF